MNESCQSLTDSQWQVITKILNDHRKRWHDLRTIIEAILWLNYTGLQWRELDNRIRTPPWQTVYYHFRQFCKRGVWEQILDALVVAERKRQACKEETPSLLAIDSQSVKIMQFIEAEVGIDAYKKINGRKRNIAVDRLGLSWSIVVTSANTSDTEAGKRVVDQLRGKVPRLEVIAADQGYKLSFIEHVEGKHGWKVEIAQKPESTRALYRKRTAGQWNVALAGSISGRSAGTDGCFEMWKKP